MIQQVLSVRLLPSSRAPSESQVGSEPAEVSNPLQKTQVLKVAPNGSIEEGNMLSQQHTRPASLRGRGLAAGAPHPPPRLGGTDAVPTWVAQPPSKSPDENYPQASVDHPNSSNQAQAPRPVGSRHTQTCCDPTWDMEQLQILQVLPAMSCPLGLENAFPALHGQR